MDEWLSELEGEVSNEIMHSADCYGLPGNKYNPELHLFCLTEEISTLDGLANKLAEVVDYMQMLIAHGWELAVPVADGCIETKHPGDPPPADSMFDEQGNDLDGNHIDYEE